MDFHSFSDIIFNARVWDEFDLFGIAKIYRDFDVRGTSTLETRLRASDTEYMLSDDNSVIHVARTSGLFKLAFLGQNAAARSLRIFVASEILPAIRYLGKYVADDFNGRASPAFPETASRFATARFVAIAHAALAGRTPLDRHFQDWLANDILPIAYSNEEVSWPADNEQTNRMFAELEAAHG